MAREAEEQTYTVDQLVAVNPYNPDILRELEGHVNEQVEKRTYNLDANLCLLRIYQFEPQRMSIQIVEHILIKALMAMPSADFSLCLFLIPENVQMEERFKTLIVLSHYLETARFQQFWDEVARNRNILEAVRGFDEAIQAYAVHVITLLYQKIPRALLAEIINIEGPSLDRFLEYQVANNCWTLQKANEQSQIIVLPKSEFNHQAFKKNNADNITMEHVARIFPVLA